MNHFPVYEPSAERLEAIRKAAEEVDAPLASHYDANKEVRAKGAAFYQFSADEEQRQRQLDELKQSREETMQKRAETGAVDVPVNIEGDMGGDSTAPTQSRAQEKRKRDLEARRQLIEAKRRRKEVEAVSEPHPTTDAIPVIPTEQMNEITQTREVISGQDASVSSGSGSQRMPGTVTTAADDFLANLERDMVNGR